LGKPIWVLPVLPQLELAQPFLLFCKEVIISLVNL